MYLTLAINRCFVSFGAVHSRMAAKVSNELPKNISERSTGFVPVSLKVRRESAEKIWSEYWPSLSEKSARQDLVSEDFNRLIFPLLEAALTLSDVHRASQVIGAAGQLPVPDSALVQWHKQCGKVAAQAREIERVSEHVRQLFLLASDAPGDATRLAAWVTAGVLLDALDDLEHFDVSEPLHRQNITIALELFGPGHRNVLDSQNDLANVLHALGQHAEAEGLLRDVLTACEHVYGPEHPGTLKAHDNLALALHLQGKHAEAEREFRHVLAIRLKVLGTTHVDTLSSRNNLALELNAQGKYAGEEQEHRAVLVARERVLGPENPQTLWTRHLLIFTQRIQNKHAVAEAGLRELLTIRERVAGSSHPDTLKTRADLAATLRVQGKHRDALKVQQELLSIREELHGPEHPEVLRSCFNVAFALLYAGDLAEAAKFAERNEQGCLKHYGPEHAQTREARKLRETIQTESSQPHWLEEFKRPLFGWPPEPPAAS